MTTTNKILRFLSGKKGAINAIIMTITGYLGAKGHFNPELVVCIGTIMGILTGRASYLTKQLHKSGVTKIK